MKQHAPYRSAPVAVLILVSELAVAGVMFLAWWFVLDDMIGFRFERPNVLQALWMGPVLAVIFLLHLAWRNKALSRFASGSTLLRAVPGISTTRMLLQFLLIRHGIGLVILALAGPQFGRGLTEVRSEGIDVMVAVDVSNSMLAEDLRPNRMEVARRSLTQLIDRLHGDRIGIIVFAGEAYVQLPITTDRSAARLFLAAVNTQAVGTQGTAIGAAIELATASFDLKQPGSRAILVITDGENHEDDAEGAARVAAEAGITVHTIGMGSEKGAPLPIRGKGQISGFRKDNKGNTVVSKLDEYMLTRIAAAGNGSYIRATEGNTGIEKILEELRTMDHVETGSWQFASHESRFQYPLGLGLLLIVIGMSFGERRNRSLEPWTV